MPESLKHLIDAFAKLPGVGEKTAMKLAFYILTKRKDIAQELSRQLIHVSEGIDECPRCSSLKDTKDELCSYCSDGKREAKVLCVVEEYADLLAIEQTGAYK